MTTRKRPRKSEERSSKKQKSQKILAIDPASICTGWAMFNTLTLVDYGLIKLKSTTPIELRILHIYNVLSDVVTKYEPELIVVEDQFHHKNAKTLKVLSWVRGVIMLLAAQHGIQYTAMAPRKAKLGTVQFGGASKEEVAAHVCKYYNITDKLDQNVTDAIAIGMAYSLL